MTRTFCFESHFLFAQRWPCVKASTISQLQAAIGAAGRDLGSSGAGIRETEHHEDILIHAFSSRINHPKPDLHPFCFGDRQSFAAIARVLWSRWLSVPLSASRVVTGMTFYSPHPSPITWAGKDREGKGREGKGFLGVLC